MQKRIACALLAVLMSAGMLGGCTMSLPTTSSNTSSDAGASLVSSEQSSSSEASEASSEAESEAESSEVSEESKAESEEESKSESKEESKKESEAESKTESKAKTTGAVSADWRDFQFAFDGQVYTMPIDYKTIADAGWTFDIADYGYEDGYVLNSGDKTTSTIDLENDKYEDVDVSIGMTNTGDKACDITEGQMWAFGCDITFTDDDEPRPEIELPGGLTWGSTVEDVIAAYGEPEDEPYYSESLGYYSYEYETEDYNKLSLIVYKDKGLTEFDFRIYG